MMTKRNINLTAAWMCFTIALLYSQYRQIQLLRKELESRKIYWKQFFEANPDISIPKHFLPLDR